MRLLKYSCLAFSGCIALMYTGVKAGQFPFKENAQSYQSYLNKLKWDSGTRVTFQNLRICSRDLNDKGYSCTAGFVTIADPQGVKVCKVRYVVTNVKGDPPYRGRTNYHTESCRWK